MSNSVGLNLGIARPGRSIVQLLKEIVQSPQFWDGIRVFGIGAAIAGSKWIVDCVWTAVVRLFTSKMVLTSESEATALEWAMAYIEQHGSWSKRAKEVEVRRRFYATPGDNGSELYAIGCSDSGIEGKHMKGICYLPLESSSVHFVFQGTHAFATRSRTRTGDGNSETSLVIHFLTFSSTVIRRFLIDAATEWDGYERGMGHVTVYKAGQYNQWERNKAIPKRKADSVHLPGAVTQELLHDARTFFSPDTRKWYADRGIPHRRGWLFYGVPGSGKTSLCHVLASELEAPVYQISLTSQKIDDDLFQDLLGRVSEGAILVLEDIDAAFTKRELSGSSNKSVDPALTKRLMSMGLPVPSGRSSNTVSNVSLSALLNGIDGMAASENRLVIMTTNNRDALDDALIRPGRVDIQTEFFNANADQARQLFLRWFDGPSGQPPSLPSHIKKSTEDGETAPNGTSGTNEKSGASTPVNGAAAESLSAAAGRFAKTLPEGRFSVASLQGYLLQCRSRGWEYPACADGVEKWAREALAAQAQKKAAAAGRAEAQAEAEAMAVTPPEPETAVQA